MKRYILTVGDSFDPDKVDLSEFDVILIEDLIRCGDCYHCQKMGGIYRCEVHGLRVYYNSFCSFALIKDKEEEDNHE